jgi:ketosteroid isomerase-like protein
MYRMFVRRKIRQAFAALSRGDAPALLAAMSPDVHHTFPGDHALGGERSTRDDVGSWLGRLFRLLPGLEFDIQTLAVDGWPWNTRIGVEWTNTGTLLDGSAYANTGAHILRVRNGKITAFHAYLHDLGRFTEALSRLSAHGLAEADAPPIVT